MYLLVVGYIGQSQAFFGYIRQCEHSSTGQKILLCANFDLKIQSNMNDEELIEHKNQVLSALEILYSDNWSLCYSTSKCLGSALHAQLESIYGQLLLLIHTVQQEYQGVDTPGYNISQQFEDPSFLFGLEVKYVNDSITDKFYELPRVEEFDENVYVLKVGLRGLADVILPSLHDVNGNNVFDAVSGSLKDQINTLVQQYFAVLQEAITLCKLSLQKNNNFDAVQIAYLRTINNLDTLSAFIANLSINSLRLLDSNERQAIENLLAALTDFAALSVVTTTSDNFVLITSFARISEIEQLLQQLGFNATAFSPYDDGYAPVLRQLVNMLIPCKETMPAKNNSFEIIGCNNDENSVDFGESEFFNTILSEQCKRVFLLDLILRANDLVAEKNFLLNFVNLTQQDTVELVMKHTLYEDPYALWTDCHLNLGRIQRALMLCEKIHHLLKGEKPLVINPLIFITDAQQALTDARNSYCACYYRNLSPETICSVQNDINEILSIADLLKKILALYDNVTTYSVS